ncbi:hypothetical protein [Pseudomonas syringae]|nr:hypothetical protein [Pseudomonas syringae]
MKEFVMVTNPEIFWSMLAVLDVFGICKTELASVGTCAFNNVSGG